MTGKTIIIGGVIIIGIGGFLFLERRTSPIPTVTPVVSGSATPRVSSQPSTSVSPSVSAPVSSANPTLTPTPSIAPTTSSSPVSVRWTVTITDGAFTPATLTVHRGDTVVFTNAGSFTQTVTAFNLAFNSNSITGGSTWTLNTSALAPGNYDYRSTKHATVRGTLIIQ